MSLFHDACLAASSFLCPAVAPADMFHIALCY